MNFRVLPEADSETVANALWYDEQRDGLGEEFFAEPRSAFEYLRRHPNLVPKLEQYSGPYLLRRQLLDRFLYMVIFDCTETELVIVAVSHVHRQPLYWLDRLN